MTRRLLAPESTIPAPTDWVAAWTRAAARDPDFGAPFAWSPWTRLEDAAAWAWFRGALDLPADWAFEGATRHLWARAGLFPGVCRIVVGADGLVDPDALLYAPDDWPNAGQLLAGTPAISFPVLTRASLWDPGALAVADVVYLLAGGQVKTWLGGLGCTIGRAPELALAEGRAWRMYATPLAWLADALQFRDGFDPDRPHAAPGGGAVVDLDRFIRLYGEDLAVDCGADHDLAARYERRRKALLRPNRPALPEIKIARRQGMAAA